MGMSSGGELFDPVVSSLIGDAGLEDCIDRNTIKVLIECLEDMDWDTQCESEFWEHPIIGKMLGNTFEEW